MRSRRAGSEQVAEVARRRLELLSAELSGRPPWHATDAQRDLAERALEVEAAQSGRHAQRPIRFAGRVGGWLHDHLPPALQGRVSLTSAHVALVALLVAAGLGVTAWWVVRAEAERGTTVPHAPSPVSRSSPLAVPLPPSNAALPGGAAFPEGAASPERSVFPSGGVSTDGGATPGAAATPTGTVVVDVAGRVRRAGIVTLPAGSRVVDAVKAAGGARRGVDLTPLNLARVLADGEQILVGVPPPSGVAASAASQPNAPAGGPAQLVNINTAGQPELETLPGIGPVTASSILDWRTENGAFTSVDELLEVTGIGDATLAELAPFVTI